MAAPRRPAPAPDADLVLPADDRGPVAPPELILEAAPLLWEKYRTLILAAVALVVIGLVGSAVVGSRNAHRLTEASAALAAAKSPEDFQKVIDTYGGTVAAADAYLLLARAQREKGDPAGAEKTLRTFTEKFPQHPLVGGAMLALAGELQSRGQADAALALYQKTADDHRNTFSAPLALFSRAELLRAQGKTDEARRGYESLIATYAQSIPGQQAVQALRMLRGPAPAATPLLPAPAPAAVPPPAPNPVGAAAASAPVAVPVPAASASPGAAPTPGK